MSNDGFDAALDFMPAAERRPGLGLFAFAAVMLEAIRQGLAASRRYESLVARGVPHAEAAAAAFTEFHGNGR